MPLVQRHAADFHVLFCGAARVLNRAFVTQQLFHCRADDFRAFSQLRHFHGMPQQRVDSVANQVPGRFVSAEKQHDALRVKLFFRQDIAIFLDVQQQADQVAALLPPPFRDRRAEKRRQRQHRLLRQPGLFQGAARVSHHNRERVRPLNEVLVQRLRHAKHLGDHAHRQRIGDLLEDIGLRLVAERFEHAFHNRFNLRTQGFRDCRGKTFVHQLAKPGMLGGVEKKHPQAQHAHQFSKLIPLVGRKRIEKGTGAPRGKPGISDDGRAFRVFEYRPHPAAIIHIVNAAFLQETPVRRIRILQELGREERFCGGSRLRLGHRLPPREFLYCLQPRVYLASRFLCSVDGKISRKSFLQFMFRP